MKAKGGKKKIAVNILMKIIFIYSAIKINVNKPPLNSVLKPETNSDSPSAKSKGVRLVSAKTDTNQINNVKGKIIKYKELEFVAI